MTKAHFVQLRCRSGSPSGNNFSSSTAVYVRSGRWGKEGEMTDLPLHSDFYRLRIQNAGLVIELLFRMKNIDKRYMECK